MVSFESDYIAGAHPEVLRRLTETNLEALPGYGMDPYCAEAKEKIRKACRAEQADVEFLVGGTQTNAVVISTLLRDYQGVLAAKTGHISTHEAGAIEYAGYEVLELPEKDGKIIPDEMGRYLKEFFADDNHEHMTMPGMVYLSHPTEYGTLYSKAELEAIAALCREYGLILYLDGARLGYGVTSENTDLSLEDIARICDAFYIGGTKMGALCGEAVVFSNVRKPDHFLTSIKKRGALLAKGRLLGVQFDALFTDDLYFRIGRRANELARQVRAILAKHGIPLFMDSPTNQQFAVLENRQMEKLKEKIAFSFWQKYDDEHTVVRFATGWSTTEEDLQALDEALSQTR